MTAIPSKTGDSPAKKWIPLLILGILGTFGVIAIYFFIPGHQSIDVLLMLVIVGLSTVGYARGIVAGALTIVFLYIATGIAAIFYQTITPYVGGIQQVLLFNLDASRGETVNRSSMALSFSLLTLVVWIILQVASRILVGNTRLLTIGILDNIGGIFVHVIIGVLVASLLFNAIGYGRSRSVHDRAKLRRTFNQVLYVHYTAQSFWFPGRPPPIYTYDLNVR